MYSIALAAIALAAAFKGDFAEGFSWLLQPGTYDELKLPVEERTWTVSGKVTVMVVFSSMGFFGSSCSAAITKNFGALTMSIVSTTRKATTLFLSFFLFHNVCTTEHLMGIFIFIAALLAKSLRRKSTSEKKMNKKKKQPRKTRRSRKGYSRNDDASSVSDVSDVELAGASGGSSLERAIPQVVHAENVHTNLRSRTNGSTRSGAPRSGEHSLAGGIGTGVGTATSTVIL